MAQELQNITIRAPAFKGLNTQDSPIDGDPSFAAVADNCVIDKYGRIGARKGFNTITTDVSALGGLEIRSLGFFEDNAGNTEVFSAGNNKIFKGTTTLTDITPASYTITDNDWKMVSFNNQMYFVQRGHEPLVYDNANGLVKVTAHPSAVGTPPNAHEATAAFGRLWTCGCGVNLQAVFWSDLLIGTSWSGGTSGSINLAKVWPDGYDEVQAIAAHNGFLVIFGRHSIVVYEGAESPATMQLVDTIANIGCIDRDSVISTGNDLLFLSHVGLQSFSRILQQKSMPVSELSRGIRDEFITLVDQETTGLRAVYSPENAFYLLYLPTANITYCFDTRGKLEDGSFRVTRWPSSPFKCFVRTEESDLFVGSALGIGKYEDYADGEQSYNLRYYSNPLSFQDSSKLKFLKKIVPTILTGATTTVFVKWGYDYKEVYSTALIPIESNVNASEYGISEYGVAEYNEANLSIIKKGINTTGQGTVVTVGVEVEINGYPFSLQEFNVQALLGRMI
jgi:hypothetical protein